MAGMADQSVLLSEYPVVISLPVQWGDQDLNAHVNNVVFFRWLESARVEYLNRLGMAHWHAGGPGPILASVKCDFKRQLQFPDTVEVGAKVTRLGRSSMTMHNSVASVAQQAIVAEGESIMVVFDYGANQSVAIPPELRQAIERLEGRALG
jgi:acyl-CoA thioester hydrolase